MICATIEKDADFFSEILETLSFELRPEVAQLGDRAWHDYSIGRAKMTRRGVRTLNNTGSADRIARKKRLRAQIPA